MTYIDIHTHHRYQAADVLNIFNVHRYMSMEAIPISEFSLSSHPWFLDRAIHIDIETCRDNENFIAIGECGLDRLCDTDWQLQLATFEAQIAWANALQKPMIIHAVRAIDDCLQLLKGCHQPVIFHGMNVRPTMIEKILQEGYYISIGKDFFQSNSPTRLYPSFVPISQLFFETDDATYPIQALYEKYGEISEIDVEELILQIEKNYNSII